MPCPRFPNALVHMLVPYEANTVPLGAMLGPLTHAAWLRPTCTVFFWDLGGLNLSCSWFFSIIKWVKYGEIIWWMMWNWPNGDVFFNGFFSHWNCGFQNHQSFFLNNSGGEETSRMYTPSGAPLPSNWKYFKGTWIHRDRINIRTCLPSRLGPTDR